MAQGSRQITDPSATADTNAVAATNSGGKAAGTSRRGTRGTAYVPNFWKIRHWKRVRRILPATNTPTHPMRKPAQKMVETLAMIL